MEAITAGVIGAAVGALGMFLAQSYFSFRDQEIAHINDFIKDLERIEQFSVRYWLNSTDAAREDQEKIAAQLRGAIHASSLFYEVGPKLLRGDWKEFEEWDGKLFDAATGGDFESVSQVADAGRVLEIMKCTNKLRALLRGARRKAFWAR